MGAAGSTAAAAPSTVVWPSAGRLAADLVQRGLLPCPAGRASAEFRPVASSTTTSTIATSATSSRSGSSRPMPMRTIRTMIATTWCGCGRITAGGGSAYMFAAEFCGPGRARDGGETRSEERRGQQGNRLPGVALIHVLEGVAHEQRSQLEQPAAYAYGFGRLRDRRCGCDNRGVCNDDPPRRYETDRHRSATGNNWSGASTSPARQRSGGAR